MVYLLAIDWSSGDGYNFGIMCAECTIFNCLMFARDAILDMFNNDNVEDIIKK